eukprot:TRINITY_DN5638_c0_g1_i1.p1 TRINITY_DN5638_c0_g1~~TRINITY_DN5638_c0_g1_i1.p1  ORF type:complete len:159 (+),score=30.40 TRINITY_DN5638_c0_g1_i1:104-580(+)
MQTAQKKPDTRKVSICESVLPPQRKEGMLVRLSDVRRDGGGQMYTKDLSNVDFDTDMVFTPIINYRPVKSAVSLAEIEGRHVIVAQRSNTAPSPDQFRELSTSQEDLSDSDDDLPPDEYFQPACEGSSTSSLPGPLGGWHQPSLAHTPIVPADGDDSN